MTPTTYALVFGGIPLVAAAVISAACVRHWVRTELAPFQASLDAQRTAGMGDPLAVGEVEPDAETPIHDDVLIAQMERAYDWAPAYFDEGDGA